MAADDGEADGDATVDDPLGLPPVDDVTLADDDVALALALALVLAFQARFATKMFIAANS